MAALRAAAAVGVPEAVRALVAGEGKAEESTAGEKKGRSKKGAKRGAEEEKKGHAEASLEL